MKRIVLRLTAAEDEGDWRSFSDHVIEKYPTDEYHYDPDESDEDEMTLVFYGEQADELVTWIEECADEYSLSYMESDPEAHPMSDIGYIAEQLGPVLKEKSKVLMAAFKAADHGSGTVSYETLQDVLSVQPGIQTQSVYGGVGGAGTVVDLRGFGAAATSNNRRIEEALSPSASPCAMEQTAGSHLKWTSPFPLLPAKLRHFCARPSRAAAP